MAYTHAIYYPWIDINDSAWLKTAILYWDKISTIVPAYMDEPYENLDCNYLKEYGVIIPQKVQPGDGIVTEASKNFLNYLKCSESKKILLPFSKRNSRFSSLKSTNQVARLNKWKLDDSLTEDLIRSGRVTENGEWLIFDRKSANYYMALLAASLANEKHLALLTNDGSYEPVTNKVRRGDAPGKMMQHLGETLLAQVVLDTVSIAEDTPLENILTFREEYSDEISKFRSVISIIAREIDPDTPSLEALEQQVSDNYKNIIHPAINDLRKALRGKKIKYATKQLSSFVFTSLIATPFLSVPQNFALSATFVLILNRINYSIDHKKDLMDAPYSFILRAQSHFS